METKIVHDQMIGKDHSLSFANNLKQFIFESGTYSIAAAILGSLSVLLVKEWGEQYVGE